MNALNLRALEIFQAVATEGSVSRAAEKLNRVQSNVSTRLRQLEEEVGRSLFLRRGRGLTLTADGHLLLSYADRLLQLSREASEALNQDAPRGLLRIGAMESTAAARLPPILSRYHALYPDVEVRIRTDVAKGLVDGLLSNDVDVAFIAEPIHFDSLRATAVFEEELVLVTPSSFPNLKSVDQISGKTVVAFELGCAYRRYLEEWLLGSGIVPGGVLAVGSYLAMLACVAAGTGYAVAPRSVLDTVRVGGEFKTHRLPMNLRRIRTMMTWRADYQSLNLNALKALVPVI